MHVLAADRVRTRARLAMQPRAAVDVGPLPRLPPPPRPTRPPLCNHIQPARLHAAATPHASDAAQPHLGQRLIRHRDAGRELDCPTVASSSPRRRSVNSAKLDDGGKRRRVAPSL